MAIAFSSCQTSSPISQSPSSEANSREATQLVLNQAILEQSNKRENTVWKIKANNIVYSEDRKTANLDRVVGNLLQNGKIILKISAKKGEVKDNGNIVILKEQIVASDPRNGSVIETDLLEWRPQENLLLIKENLTGIHPNLKVTAQKGKYFTDIESLEIEGNVVTTTEKPASQLTSDRLVWDVAGDVITSPDTVKIVGFNEHNNITDELNSDHAMVNLATNTATLNDNIELISLQPKIQAATESLVWNYQQRIGKTEQPIQIINRDRSLTLTGNKGEFDLQQQIAKLNNGIQGINQKKGSNLYARQLTWKIATEEVEATGNVIYEQVDPKARLTGEKAVGTLNDNNIVVTSNGKKQVTSIIDN